MAMESLAIWFLDGRRGRWKSLRKTPEYCKVEWWNVPVGVQKAECREK